jgi:methylenetetrahydrofolate dehydrogenase (NADP+)/methenyltetrahydrofolate cyclohydrolase
VGLSEEWRLYVKSMRRVAVGLGVLIRLQEFPPATVLDTLIDTLKKLNEDISVDGVILQSPLPSHLPNSVYQEINPKKDVEWLQLHEHGQFGCV